MTKFITSHMKDYLDNYAIRDARETLSRAFRDDELCEGADSPIVRKALSLLVFHPQLAQEWFEATDEDGSIRFLPLSIFVASGATLEVVEAVYHLYPEAVSVRHPDLKVYPLQAACEVHADDDVIAFLARKFPQAVEERDYKGDMAIHSILNQGKEQLPRRKTVEMLLDLYPQCVREVNNEGACPLGIAFRNKQGPKVIDRIVEKREAQGIDSFNLLAWSDYTLTAADVTRMTLELFPKLNLKSFRCEPDEFDEDGFAQLMESLATDETIQKFTVAFPAMASCKKSEAFLGFLKRNKTVRHLTLTRNLSMWSRGNGVDTLLQGLEAGHPLHTLRLSGLFLMSSFEVGHLISRSPKKLVLNTVMIESRWRAANHKQWSRSKLEDLTIRNCKMRGSSLDSFLESLAFLPRLKRLLLDYSNPEDQHDERHLRNRVVTKPILALLKDKGLASLTLHGLRVDVPKLAATIHKNKTLKKLHIDGSRKTLAFEVGCLVGAFLKGNQALEDVKFHCDYKYDEKEPDGDGQLRPKFEYVEDEAIKYYTKQNRAARGAKASSATDIQTI